MAIYRFDAYELDTASGELTRDGRPVTLRPQPASALGHLVERHGQFVSREDLRRALWPSGTFVQFHHGLNSCVKQIRAALGDTRARPRFVETLTRRGYRFVADVSRVDRPVDPAASFEALIESLTAEIAHLVEHGIRTALARALPDGRIHQIESAALTCAPDSDRSLTAPSFAPSSFARLHDRALWNQQLRPIATGHRTISKQS